MSQADTKISEDVKKIDEANSSNAPSDEFKNSKVLIDEFGQTALHWAAGRGNYAAVETLLEMLEPEYINKQAPGNNDYTALHLAVIKGHVNIVKLFINKKQKNNSDNQGADINLCIPDMQGETSLHLAVSAGKTDIAKALIDVMTPDQISLQATKRHGYTALHMAVQSNNRELVEYLLKTKNSKLIEATDEYGQTALHWSAARGYAEITSVLLKAINNNSIIEKPAVKNQGYTALHLAIQSNSVETVKILLDKATNKLMETEDVYRQKPILWAAQNPAMVKLFDEYGKNSQDTLPQNKIEPAVSNQSNK